MFELIDKGGPLMLLIIVCSILSVAIFLERWLYLSKSVVDTQSLMDQLSALIKRNQMTEALQVCQKTVGPVAAILAAGLMRFERTREEIRQAMEEAGAQQTAKLEKNLTMLSTIAQVTPLLGLLGTVSGMISAFRMIQEKAAAGVVINPGDLAGGIWEALITTAAGLVVAIPSFVAYNYLLSRIDHLVLDMEEQAGEMAHTLIAGRAHEV